MRYERKDAKWLDEWLKREPEATDEEAHDAWVDEGNEVPNLDTILNDGSRECAECAMNVLGSLNGRTVNVTVRIHDEGELVFVLVTEGGTK